MPAPAEVGEASRNLGANRPESLSLKPTEGLRGVYRHDAEISGATLKDGGHARVTKAIDFRVSCKPVSRQLERAVVRPNPQIAIAVFRERLHKHLAQEQVDHVVPR